MRTEEQLKHALDVVKRIESVVSRQTRSDFPERTPEELATLTTVRVAHTVAVYCAIEVASEVTGLRGI